MPNASKIGTLHVDTPIVAEGIDGSVFVAQQDDPATTAPGAEKPLRLDDRAVKLSLKVERSQRSTWC
jgi:hypothetical protein